MKQLVRFAQLIFAITFIVSGLTKCIDPAGTAIKFTEYLQYFGLNSFTDITMGMAWFVSIVEFVCGFSLFIGYGRRLSLVVSTFLMCIFTPLTFWLATTDAIQECGCFGDAIHLTNWQSFSKNVILCALIAIIWYRFRYTYRFFGKTASTIYLYYGVGVAFWLCTLATLREPFVDFRPYQPGTDLLKATMGEEAISESSPNAYYTCIYSKDGQEKEFPLDSIPDEAEGWIFVDTIEHLPESLQSAQDKGHIDFFAKTPEGQLFTKQLLTTPGFTLLLLSPSLDEASQHDIDRIEQLWEYAIDHEYPFYCLTARDEQQLDNWRLNTGAEYDFLFTDASVVQTICRSNPVVMLLHDGVICWKRPLSSLDTKLLTSAKLSEQSSGQIEENDPQKRIFLLFVLLFAPFPLFLLFEIPQKFHKQLKKDSKDA